MRVFGARPLQILALTEASPSVRCLATWHYRKKESDSQGVAETMPLPRPNERRIGRGEPQVRPHDSSSSEALSSIASARLCGAVTTFLAQVQQLLSSASTQRLVPGSVHGRFGRDGSRLLAATASPASEYLSDSIGERREFARPNAPRNRAVESELGKRVCATPRCCAM
jgi:hypothetical protein